MCQVLQIHRSLIYRRMKCTQKEKQPDPFCQPVLESFHRSKPVYGARKIKAELARQDLNLSRCRIRRIMKEHGCESVYTIKKYRAPKREVNESATPNRLAREFNQRAPLEVIVSDLTYLRVAQTWHYLCPVQDLFNREIIGWSIGAKKNGELVKQAFLMSEYNLSEIQMFHSDRGGEFKNRLLEEMMEGFSWNRSLSRKGCPFDNAVIESLNHTIKTEFVRGRVFESLEQLKMEFFEYVHWYNHHRLHGSLSYHTPMELRKGVL